MADATLYTYQDAIDHLLDYLGANPAAEARRVARRAILDALRILPAEANWHYYYQQGRLATVASQTTGTVAYDDTGGTYERMVTLSDATWPSWVRYGVLAIGSVTYEIAEKKTSTVLTLSANANPGADVAADTSYTLYRDTYPMPTDFQAVDEFVEASGGPWLAHAHPREWIAHLRNAPSPGTPSEFCFTKDPNYQGTLAVRFAPAPASAYHFDYLYKCRPRPVRYDAYSTGTVASLVDTATISGTGTAWTSAMAGSVIRLSDDALNLPTALEGAEPAAFERVIMSVESATSLTVDDNLTGTSSGVKYLISDPIDIEDGAMRTAFLRLCERQVAVLRNMPVKKDADMAYGDALRLAMQADSRYFGRRVATACPPWRGVRFANIRLSGDVG